MPWDARLKGIEEARALRASFRHAPHILESPASLTVQAWSGNTWTNIGPMPIVNPFGGNEGGRVNAIAVDPTNSNNIYIGAAEGGVWRTKDGGTTWTPLTDQLASLAIGSIAVDPSNPTTIYAGTGDNYGYTGVGLLKSTNGGDSWTLITQPFSNGGYAGQRIDSLAVSPTNSQIVLAGVEYASFSQFTPGIYRSTNGGANWTRVLAGPVALQVLFHPTNGNIAYATLAQGDGSKIGVYQSTDAGQTWNPVNGTGSNVLTLTDAHDIHIAIAASSPTTLYASVGGGSGLIGLFRTNDSGANWTKLSATPPFCSPQCSYDNVVAVSPSDPNVIFAGGVTLVRSTDGGTIWSNTSSAYVDHHALVFAGAGRLLVGNDGGMWTTTNPLATAPTWTSLNTSLSLTQFYPGISIHPTNINLAYGGAQDTGLQKYVGTKGWPLSASFFGGLNCGDAGWTAFDYSTANTAYMDTCAEEVFKTTDGTNWHKMITGINTGDIAEFAPPLAIDPVTPQRVYFATYRVYQSINGAGSWTAISGDLSGGNGNAISDIAVAPSNSNYVYTTSTGGKFYVTTNASAGTGAVWTDRSSGLPPGFALQGLAVDPHNEQIVYTATMSFNGARLFRSTSAGQGWTDITGNLPSLPIDSLAVDPDIAGTIYVGTEQGVYASVDNGATWQPVGTGLPLVVVTSIRVHHATRTLRVGTYGRGMWDLSVPILAPALSITKTHSGSFAQGQGGAAYTVTVSNGASAGPTSGTVTVTDTLPSGLAMAGMSGTGWNCSGNTCTRSDVLFPGTSYPAITVMVNVATNASSPQVNQAGVAGGGSASASVMDSTVIQSPGTLSLSRNKLNFGISAAGSTSPQTIGINFTGGSSAWTASSNQSNITVSPMSGAGNGSVQISASAGSSGTVTITAPGAMNSPQQVQVSVVNVTPGNPFGSFDTPTNNTTGAAGAIPVTGWALDNIEVVTLGIYREPLTGETPGANGLIFIGNAVFVVGARPDVEASFPNEPFNYRAGWGYLLLSNFLPNGGNGTFKLHALATNKTGSTVDLGTRTVTFDNAHAAKPFGTIDTPAQGGTASGAAYVNFGWALTQNPYMIPTNGSTILVYVDGVQLGHPTYNQYRSDIATLFPGYSNSGGAVGYYVIDTTKLSNGVHTIFWTVTDNGSRADGVGSRYFGVANTGATQTTPQEPIEPAAGDVPRSVDIEELGRVELHAGAVDGYLWVNGERRPLPIGSTLKGGVFYWHPGPGFHGEYNLVLISANGEPVPVRVRIRPKTYPTAPARAIQ